MRLQRYMAMAGIASRRHCETLIQEGRVTINGKMAVLGDKVDDDIVLLDGQLVTAIKMFRYYAFYKPSKVMTTLSDPQGRPTISSYLDAMGGRLFPVGRLDFLTEGLLLLTDDGDWAQRIAHPSHEVEKEYIVLVTGEVTQQHMAELRTGVMLDNRLTSEAKVDKLVEEGNRTRLRITIHEGRNRQIRRMLEQVGLEAVWLCRTRVGPVRLGTLKPGENRILTPQEMTALDKK